MTMRKYLAVAMWAALMAVGGAARAQNPAAPAQVRPLGDVHAATKTRGWDALYKRYSVNDLANIGRLYVSFTVEPDGRVSWVRVLSTTVNNPFFVSAVVDQLRATRFPAREVAAFTYPRVSMGYVHPGNESPQVTAGNADAYLDAMTRALKDPPAAHPDRAAIYGVRMEAYRAKGMLAQAYADGDAMLSLAKDQATAAAAARAGTAAQAQKPALAAAGCQQALQAPAAGSRAQACGGRLKMMVASARTSSEVGMP